MTPPRNLVLGLIVFALVIGVVLQVVGAPLSTAAAPSGILSYEFAGDSETVQAILASWDQRAQLHAALSLGLDYLFLVAYSSAIAAASFRIAAFWRRHRPTLATAGAWLAWGQWLAALFDAIENYALIRLLLGDTAPAWPPLAWWCAALKFLLVLLGLLYVLSGAIMGLLGLSQTRGQPAR